MTHDELRAKIQHYNWVEAAYLIKALDAVVALHTSELINARCMNCAYGNKCETIKVIEKELL